MCFCTPNIRTPFCNNCNQAMFLRISELKQQRDELLAAINKFLSDNNPEGFGCACEPNRLCGPCSEAKRQAPLYAAIAKEQK